MFSRKKIFFSILFGSFLFSTSTSWASYLSISGNTATIDENSNDCEIASDGTIASGGGGCIVYIPIPVPTGNTLSSVNVYFYDNSGSQSITAYARRNTLGVDGYTTYNTQSDTSTSASIQYVSLSYSTSVSSSYSYFVQISLNYGTELRAIRIYYY